MTEQTTVFERHSEFYGRNKPLPNDYFFLTHMKLRKTGQTRLLDVGGGSGAFAILVKEAIPQSEVTVVDPTQNLLDMITDPHIKKIKGNLPYNLNIDDASFFDYICVKEVLHHLTNSSISGSKNLTIESLLELKTHIDRFNPTIDGSAIRSAYAIGKDDIVLFFMGLLYHFSGLKEVCLELARSRDRYRNLRILIVGDEDAYSDLQQIRDKN